MRIVHSSKLIVNNYGIYKIRTNHSCCIGAKKMTNLQQCLAKNMKFYRKKEGLSQAALAERAGTAANYIALIEVGKNFPSLQMIEKIATALHVDALDLFDKNRLMLIDAMHLQNKLLASITEVVHEHFASCAVVESGRA